MNSLLDRFISVSASSSNLSASRLSVAFIFMLFCAASCLCPGQTQSVICNEGGGSFQKEFTTGVTVRVGAVRKKGLSTRACEAKLIWKNQEVQVIPAAFQIDIDLLGAYIGLGEPVVAFQVKKTDADFRSEYRIYSLEKPCRLLRTITGGDRYNAEDTNLDNEFEIWTTDASGVNNFENLPFSSLDFAPSVALRFEDHKLIDVSSKFKSHYDLQIAEVRAHLDPLELRDFKSSDGILSMDIPMPSERRHLLMRTKIKVLEIVWSYLYSGREKEAWAALQEMWPAVDVERIRASMQNARNHGILSGTDGISGRISLPRHKNSAIIFDAVPPKEFSNYIENGSIDMTVTHRAGLTGYILGKDTDTLPEPILLLRPLLLSDQEALSKSEQKVVLVIDAAGKVHSAESDERGDKALIDATAGWKFIPAYKNGHPVASQFPYVVWFRQ
jgi:hypothetical protein